MAPYAAGYTPRHSSSRPHRAHFSRSWDRQRLCARVSSCRTEVTQALVDRLPGQSEFGKNVKKKLPSRLMPRLIKSCRQRFSRLSRSRKWKDRLTVCAAKKGCKEFARCIAPALEP